MSLSKERTRKRVQNNIERLKCKRGKTRAEQKNKLTRSAPTRNGARIEHHEVVIGFHHRSLRKRVERLLSVLRFQLVYVYKESGPHKNHFQKSTFGAFASCPQQAKHASRNLFSLQHERCWLEALNSRSRLPTVFHS